MSEQYVTLNTDDSVVITLPDGRTAHVWLHHCPECTSLDVWTYRGREVEDISRNTGDKARAPMGVMPWMNGARPKLDAQPCEGSHGWPAVSSMTLVWHDEDQA